MGTSFFTCWLLALDSQRFLRDRRVGDCSQVSHSVWMGNNFRMVVAEAQDVSDMTPAHYYCSDGTGT